MTYVLDTVALLTNHDFFPSDQLLPQMDLSTFLAQLIVNAVCSHPLHHVHSMLRFVEERRSHRLHGQETREHMFRCFGQQRRFQNERVDHDDLKTKSSQRKERTHPFNNTTTD